MAEVDALLEPLLEILKSRFDRMVQDSAAEWSKVRQVLRSRLKGILVGNAPRHAVREVVLACRQVPDCIVPVFVRELRLQETCASKSNICAMIPLGQPI